MSGKTVEDVLNAVADAAADVGGAVLHAVGLTTDGAEVLVDEVGQAVAAEAPAPGEADAPGQDPAYAVPSPSGRGLG